MRRVNGVILLAVGFALIAFYVVIGSSEKPEPPDTLALVGRGVLSDTTPATQRAAVSLVKNVLFLSIGALSLFWAVALWIFASSGQLALITELVRSGLVLKLVTVVGIVAIVFMLGLLGRLDPDQVSTILAAIAGYVLGESAATERRNNTPPAGPSTGASPTGPGGLPAPTAV